MHAALWAGPVGVALAFFSLNLAVVFLGLLIFGAALGLAYSASLYYTMSYGETKGEHGGLHEGILGMGAFVGPLVGALTCGSLGTVGAQWAIVLLPLAAMGVGIPLITLRSRREATG